MKSIVQQIIKKRNSNFLIDADVSRAMLFSFVLINASSLFRGCKLLFRLRFPQFALLGKGVQFKYLNRISFGKFLKLGDHVHLAALGKNGINLGDNVGIGSFSRVIVSTTLNNLGDGIVIGSNVGIGEYAYLGGAGGLTIGKDCIIGQYFSCHPENHVFSGSELIRHQGATRKGIKLGENCWVGSKVSILDGVSVGNGCVIAAGSVVTRSFPANSVIGGVPAKLIKARINA